MLPPPRIFLVLLFPLLIFGLLVGAAQPALSCSLKKRGNTDSLIKTNLTAGQIFEVSNRLTEAALLSWELGTRAQSILEINATSYSVFSPNALPPPATVPSNLSVVLSPFFTIAHDVVANRSMSNFNRTGPQPLMNDSSAGDPASIGVAVLLANWTGLGAIDGLNYSGAAIDQLDYLYEVVPHTEDWAISHRVDELQLWSDSVYMVPPFLAYYGVMTQNITILTHAFYQIRLYRQYLMDTDAHNLWRHIVFGSIIPADPGHWSTGNAWAAAGMLRVLATIMHSQYSNNFAEEKNAIASYISEIHTAMYSFVDSTNIFRNYVDDSSTFYDASSTALLASTVYRLSVLWGDHSHIPQAEAARKALFRANFTSTSSQEFGNSTQHITSDGWLTPVVNPHDFGSQGNESAEGQAFVLDMQAAWQDWVNAGSHFPVNAAVRMTGSSWWWMWWAGWIGLWMLLI